MNYQTAIIELVKQIHSVPVLKRIYRYVYRLFLRD